MFVADLRHIRDDSIERARKCMFYYSASHHQHWRNQALAYVIKARQYNRMAWQRLRALNAAATPASPR